jgi:hypothetical protein
MLSCDSEYFSMFTAQIKVYGPAGCDGEYFSMFTAQIKVYGPAGCGARAVFWRSLV